MLTITLGLGIFVSVVLHALIGLSAGGFVTAGYIALVLDQWPTLVVVIGLALVIWACLHFAARWLFLFGPRRFGLAILLSLVFSAGLELIRPFFGPLGLEWRTIGYIVPGLIANQIDRQGVVPTLVMIAIAAPIVRVLAMVIVRW